MSNSLFNFMGPQTNSTLISQLNQFRSFFSGNPQQQVQNLLNSGRMSQEQFNQLAQMANQLRPFIK